MNDGLNENGPIFIVGLPRSGTTLMGSLLSAHPAIAIAPETHFLNHWLKLFPYLCLPQGTIEPMFFDRYYAHGLAHYVSHFSRQRPGQRCGEISPTYFDAEPVPERIYQLNQDCRIIITLRNPISRALSLYCHHLSKGRVEGSFRRATAHMPRIIDTGRYAQYIPRWLDIFVRVRSRSSCWMISRTNPKRCSGTFINFSMSAQSTHPRLPMTKSMGR